MRRLIHKIRERGFSLIEAMIGVSILGIVVSTLMSGSFDSERQIKRMNDKTILNTLVWELFDNISGNLGKYQISYDSNERLTKEDDINELKKLLPIAWDMDGSYPINECKDCPGRMGFVIKPLPGQRGLYQIVIKATHDQLFPGSYRTFYFLIKGL